MRQSQSGLAHWHKLSYHVIQWAWPLDWIRTAYEIYPVAHWEMDIFRPVSLAVHLRSSFLHLHDIDNEVHLGTVSFPFTFERRFGAWSTPKQALLWGFTQTWGHQTWAGKSSGDNLWKFQRWRGYNSRGRSALVAIRFCTSSLEGSGQEKRSSVIGLVEDPLAIHANLAYRKILPGIGDEGWSIVQMALVHLSSILLQHDLTFIGGDGGEDLSELWENACAGWVKGLNIFPRGLFTKRVALQGEQSSGCLARE